jgi:hypothetical protein
MGEIWVILGDFGCFCVKMCVGVGNPGKPAMLARLGKVGEGGVGVRERGLLDDSDDFTGIV